MNKITQLEFENILKKQHSGCIAMFKNLDFSDIKFKNKYLNNVSFNNCHMNELNFENCNFRDVYFNYCSCVGSFFDETIFCDSMINYSNFSASSFRKAELDLNINYTNLDLCDFVYSYTQFLIINNCSSKESLWKHSELKLNEIYDDKELIL